MERADRAALSALPGAFVDTPLRAPGTLVLDDETAHHLRVRRLGEGDRIRVTDGLGAVGHGTLASLGKRGATVELEALHHDPAPPPVRLLVPVADRDRMLWLAEKSAELGLTWWTPVRWDRSRSVSPRGEGEQFRAKARARMIAALVQSGGAWLPRMDAERDGAAVVAAETGGADGARLLLDAGGPPLLGVVSPLLASSSDPAGTVVTVALGPEGGLTSDETAALVGVGYRRCGLGDRILRFETAAVAALALVDAARSAGCAPSDGDADA
ncbi:MAG: RsmE family RNA methyltransferase [Gemmatimonadaceae bacterium]